MASSSSHAGCMNRFPSPDATASNQVPSDAPRSHLRSYTRYALDQECQTVPSSSSACQAGPSRLLHHQQHSQSRCINGTLGLTLPAPVSTAASCLLDGRTSAARLLAVASPATTSAQMFLTTPASLPSATNVFMSSREVGDAQPIKRISPLSSSFDKAQEWFDSRRWSKEEVDNFLYDYRTVLTAGTASLVSTAASFPFDSVKSRLQVRDYPSIWACAKSVVREEGFRGFFRGVTIPLITISFVRTSSFSIYFNTKQKLHEKGVFARRESLVDTALSGAAGGATSGIIISCGSAPFELVKVQRQLEYLIAVQKGLVTKAKGSTPGRTFVPQSGFAAASNIFKNHGGPKGFYMGFPLHMMRDTLGTALYFGFYDTIRKLVSRHSTGDGRSGPQLFGLPGPVVSFLSGSAAGIFSWLLVYPVDLIKTKVQRDALAGNPRQFTGWQVFLHMIREKRPTVEDGKGRILRRDTFLSRFLRLYRGLGVSALRSFISHGLTWTLIETISQKISDRTGRPINYVPDSKKENS